MLQLLNANEASVNNQDSVGEFALKSAARTGFTEVIEILLSNGAEINLQDTYGSTSLMQAARSGNYEAVQTLIEIGADLEIVDNWLGRTALFEAGRNVWTDEKVHGELEKVLNSLHKPGTHVQKQVQLWVII